MPDLLKRTLREESWRERVIARTGEPVTFLTFVEFVETPPLEGLGADLRIIKNLVRDDEEARDLLDRTLQNKAGRPSKTVDNVHDKPDGNSEDAALRRLRKDRPDLHRQVLNRELSAHRAMVEAGFRRPTATIYVDSPQAAVEGLLRRFSATELLEALREEGK